MITIGNDKLRIEVDDSNGLICGLYSPLGKYNLADTAGAGSFCYTLKGADIKTDENFVPYADEASAYDSVFGDGNHIKCRNDEFDVDTTYTVNGESLIIESKSNDERLAQFGIDLNLNFITKNNSSVPGQLLPSSPYTSCDGKKMYFIMPIIDCGFAVVIAKTPCKAWKTLYLGQIQTVRMLSSLPDYFDKGANTDISLEIRFSKTIEECYDEIRRSYECPMIRPEITGTFDTYLELDILGDADYIVARSEYGEKKIDVMNGKAKVTSDVYGRYEVIPYRNGEAGLDTVIWFGEDVDELFEKSCDSVKKPYHGDQNLCEGMVWCWSLICYMRAYKSKKYLGMVEDALKTVMGEKEPFIERQTIVPYALDGVPAYHIYRSVRIQEQFFGISILIEMFKFTNERKYLDFAIAAAKTVIDTYQQENGAFVTFSEKDYTTVCAPMIPIVDLAVLLRDMHEEDAEYFARGARKTAEHLLARGLYFPTEGGIKGATNKVMEDGSISCTALSLLYYCRYMEYVPEYVEFSKKVLDFHDWWRSYTPDVRIYMSTMRWWETKWEGDATGCAICCGHAWSIWRAEADLHMAVVTKDPKYFISSWNGYMTNFSKIYKDGSTYACYQPDYFPGGGLEGIRRYLLNLSEEDHAKKYEIVHDYPKHKDNSLSRYVWVRFCAAWQNIAVVVKKKDGDICLNCKMTDDGIDTDSFVKKIYVFDDENGLDIIEK